VDQGAKQEGISIGFDAKRALFNYSGLGNYSRNLLSALVKYYPGNSYFLFTPDTRNRIIMPDEEKFRLIEPEKYLFRILRSLWRMKFMVNDLKRHDIEIYHGLSQEIPWSIEKSGIKSVITVHDLIFMRFPGYYKGIDSKIYTGKLIRSCRVSDRIVAISKQTRDDLIKFLNIPCEKISVIYPGCNQWFWDFDRANTGHNIRMKYNLPEKYLLYVSTIEKRKNLLGILEAMNISKIDIPLVVIGRKSHPYFEDILRYIASNNIRNVIFPGGVMNTELPAIYRNAECFIYPSFFEGFGLPVLEALVSGTPVITSKEGCFAEAGGPGSLYIDPHNPEEMGQAILRVINDKKLREKMISEGVEYASGFRDEVLAHNYMKIYNSLLN
jgi:glycosyltransferase involved in cell wall biosynthesis